MGERPPAAGVPLWHTGGAQLSACSVSEAKGDHLVTIELHEDEALVLFEFLARHDEVDSVSRIRALQIEDPAELYALWQVHGALERTLVAPFGADYRAQVDAARMAVRTRWGDE